MNDITSPARLSYGIRPMREEDKEFTCQLYADTRTEEMKLTDWTDEQKSAFLRSQFEAQSIHYQNHYPEARYYIIEHEGVSIGRLILEYTQQQHLIMDIALLSEYRNFGIGTAIIQELMIKARQADKPLVLRVEFFNPAIQLYSHLGFVKTREVNSVYHEMIWSPNQNAL